MEPENQTNEAPLQNASEKALAARYREISILTRSLLETEDALEREKSEHEATRLALKKARYNATRGYDAIVASTSWRITAPLRWIAIRLRRR